MVYNSLWTDKKCAGSYDFSDGPLKVVKEHLKSAREVDFIRKIGA
ncbi:hypothetical protein [Marinifilum fragile]|nr:hypothetical protein [Marinifilum fragile]